MNEALTLSKFDWEPLINRNIFMFKPSHTFDIMLIQLLLYIYLLEITTFIPMICLYFCYQMTPLAYIYIIVFDIAQTLFFYKIEISIPMFK